MFNSLAKNIPCENVGLINLTCFVNLNLVFKSQKNLIGKKKKDENNIKLLRFAKGNEQLYESN